MTAYKTLTQVPAGIFRAYDIRGVVEQELTDDVVYTIALAIGSEAQDQGQKEIIIGRDGRLSSPAFADALIGGLRATGIDVIDIGLAPSPVLYFATHRLATNSGVVITGSHNPVDYNGIKIVLAGKTLASDEVQAIYQRIVKQAFYSGAGQLSQQEVVPDYIGYISDHVQLSRSLKIVIDCGNGVAGSIVPILYRALGCEVEALFCEVDGRFPNHHPDPSVASNLQTLIAAVQASGADCGLAFDGDADRLGLVTEEGAIIWPDQQMMLFASDVLARNPGADIVFDVKCTQRLAETIRAQGGNPIMWQTGHSILKAKMQEVGAPLAGEMSGHIFFKEDWFGFDDGIYAGARFLEILARQEKTATQLFADFPVGVNTPELKVYLPEAEKQGFVKRLVDEAEFADANIITIDGLRVEFSDGWLLVRASNTVPCLTVRFEANSAERLAQLQAQLRGQMLALNPELELPF